MSDQYFDASTPLSNWTLHPEKGYYYASYRTATGELKYKYSQTPPDTIPRSEPGITNWNTSPGERSNDAGEYTLTPRPTLDNSSWMSQNTWPPTENYTQSAPVNTPTSQYPAPALQYSKVGEGSSSQYGGPSSEPQGELPWVQVQMPNGETVSTKYISRNSNGSNSGQRGTLSTDFVAIDEKRHPKFWKPGRVFRMLWTEAARPGGREGSRHSTVWLKGKVFSEIRRFIVIAEGEGNVVCFPIHTYEGKATLKPNLPEVQQHAMVHTSPQPPPPHTMYDDAGNFVAQEERLGKLPIRVIQELGSDDGDLGTCSRINYAKPYTVEKYVLIQNIGMTHPNSIETLKMSSPWSRSPEEPPQPPSSRSKGKGRSNRHGSHR